MTLNGNSARAADCGYGRPAAGEGVASIAAAAGAAVEREIPSGSAGAAESIDATCCSPIAATAAEAEIPFCVTAGSAGTAESIDASHQLPIGAVAGKTAISETIGARFAGSAKYLLRARAGDARDHQGEGKHGRQQEPR